MKRLLLHSGLVLLVVTIVAVLGLVGCGGSNNSNNNSAGLIFGVNAVPADGSTGIAVGDDVYISWPVSGYPPPVSFTFKMEEETVAGGWSGVFTDSIGSSMVSGVETWRFRPVDFLTYYTWFRVTLTDDTGRTEVVMFRSAKAPAIASQSTQKSDKSASKGAIEHTIQVR